MNEQVVAVQIKKKSFWKIREHAFDKIIKEFDFELKNGKFKDFKKNKVETLHDLVQFCSSEMLEKIQDEWLQKTGKVVGILEKKTLNPRLEFSNYSKTKIKITHCFHQLTLEFLE